MAAGMVSGAIIGGVKGAVVGAISGAMFGGIAGQYGDHWNAYRVAEEGAAGGISSTLSGGKFWQGFGMGAGASIISWAEQSMRESMAKQSMKDPRMSDAAQRGYIAGSRPSANGHHWTDDIFGGRQGQAKGRFFWWTYDRGEGSWMEHLCEAYAGPHDWLSSFHYTSAGLNRDWGWFGEKLFGAYGATALVPATAFVGATNAPFLAPMLGSKEY